MKIMLQALLIPCLILDVALVIFAATRPDRKRTSWLSLLYTALMIYALGYLAEVSASTLDGVWSALLVENFAIPVIPWFFLLATVNLFAPVRFKRWHGVAALGYLAVSYLLILTNPYHGLYYTSMEMVDGFVRLGRGPLYIINQVFTVACMVLAYIVMAVRFAKGSRKLRRQMTYFIIGSLIAFSANLLNTLSVLPSGVDPTPFALTLGQVCFSLSLFRNDMMGVVVHARDRALENMSDGLIVLDQEGDFLYSNQCAVRIFPQLKDFQGTEPITSLQAWPQQLSGLQEEQITFSLGERSYRATVQKINGAGNMKLGMSVLLHDASEEILLIQKLEELATTDPLTGILNRRRFIEMAQRDLHIAKRNGETSALIMFDIDHFKHINDYYGHPVGDLVLQKAVDSIRNTLRVYDLFCRYGGEEFMIYTKSPGEKGLCAFAERLRRAVEEMQVTVNGEQIGITASFGVVEIPPGGDLQAALSRVDVVMYQAKERGRNCVVVD